MVVGGTQPIVGATVSLWSSGTAATQLGLSATSDASGNFTLSFTCPSAGTLMYAIAAGGQVGGGTANAHIQLASALGACGSLPASIVINEFTSAATAYALNGFASPASGSVKFQGKSPGLDQAFNTLTNLTVTTTGAFETTGPETNKTLVQQTLDTLANAMAACDVSTTAAACAELFSCATPNANYVATGQPCTLSGSPTLTSDTLSAALAVVQNAGIVGLQGIFDVGTTTGNAFTPVLAGSPNDWTLPLIYTLKNFGPLAIDAAGHVWILSSDPNPPAPPAIPSLAVIEVDANFNLLSPALHGWNGGGVSSFDHTDLTNLAIDTGGNVWVGGSSAQIAELSSTGAAVSPSGGWSTGSTGPDGTAGVAIDSAGDAWFASGQTAQTVYELDPSGNRLNPLSSGFAASNCPCTGIAADPSGNIWLSAQGSSQYLAEVSPAGVQGAILHPPGFVDATLYSIAADTAGNLWLADQHNHGVWEYTPSTHTWSGAGGGGPYVNNAAFATTSRPKGIAIDGAGHKWVANEATATLVSSITELSADGSINLSPDDGFGSGTITGAYSVAIDGSGNVWVADGGTTIIQFVGAAAPTRNPIVSGVTAGFAP
jgi:hypothetical protein